jgi:DNA polymerase elongation subunit (family B)
MYHFKSEYISDSDINSCNKVLPKRRDFLDDDEVKSNYDKINELKELYFLGNDVKECLPFHDYTLIISGILTCGAKTVLEITGIQPYIDVEMKQSLSDYDNKKYLRNILTDEKIVYNKMNVVEGKDLIYHSFDIKRYMRIYFKNTYTRKNCIKIFEDRNITTYNNDTSSYYRVVTREYKFNLGSWNTINNYKDLKKQGKYKSKYHLSVDVNDIKPVDQDVVINNPILMNDRLVSCCFDIEMYTPDLGKIPSGKCKHDIVFMLCMTFQFINESNSFLNICLVTKECDNQDNLFTVICDNEKALLKLFSKILNRMQPDFITEFNGSKFDWKVIIEKAQSYNILKYICKNMSIENLTPKDLESDNINTWMISSIPVKVEANRSVQSYNIKLFGFIPFDTRIIFMKLYPTDPKSSLNYYLEKLGLALKDDMDFQDMFKIYESGTSDEMARVAHYCYIDSYRLHELLMAKNVFKDKRELATLSYTNIFDSFYRADGIRVRNLIVSNCLDQKLFYNNIIKETPERSELKKIKYPGALVLNPIKGLVSNVYNIKEFIIKNEYEIDDDELDLLYNIIKKNYNDIFINKNAKFDIDDDISDEAFDCLRKYIKYIKNNEIKYPVSGLDFASLYPSIIMARNLSPEYLIKDDEYYEQVKDKVTVHKIKFELFNINKQIDGYSILMSNGEDRDTGLYPSILIKLFNERVKIKKVMKKYEDRIEDLDNLEKDEPGKHRSTDEYKDCVIKYNYYNAKQAALKVLMNTFYGETGNADSPLFLLPLAGGVTSEGQRNLKLVKKFIETKLDVKVYYGDSVVGETPTIIKNKFIINIMAIKDILWSNVDRIEIHGDKEIINVNKDDNIEVYTENGFTPIIRCIRHKTSKKLFRVTTNSGMVIVTEDHSLLNMNKEKITPDECEIGTNLLHWNNLMFKTPDPVYNMIHSCIKPIVIKSKSQLDLQIRFLILFNQGHKNIEISFEDGYYVLTTNLINDNYDFHDEPNMIKSIEYIGLCDDYVYDFETASHHFAAGIGRLVVHNTDSLYISCPKTVYAKLDKKYYTNQITKLEYNTGLVEETFVDIDRIKQLVNKYLMKDNGTGYLRMSYEEVLFPVVFLSKKKYFGSPHKSIANFKPSDLFKKGLDMKKRGVSQLLVKIYSDIMWEAMSLDNISTLKEIVIKYIEILFTKDWGTKDFIKSGIWNPNKQNKQNLTFMARMMQENKSIPGIGSRFDYLVVKRYPYKYDIKGRQKILTIGDKMEYPSTFENGGLEIDLNYYFGNELTGQFARLITYDAEYEIYINDEVDDKATYENCKKVIKLFADKYNTNYVNVGKIYKKLYKNVKVQLNNVSVLNPQMKCITMNNADSFEEFINNIKENVKNRNNSNMANKLVKKSENKSILYKMFSNKRITTLLILLNLLKHNITLMINALINAQKLKMLMKLLKMMKFKKLLKKKNCMKELIKNKLIKCLHLLLKSYQLIN